MRDVHQSFYEAWNSGDYTGENQPYGAITVEHCDYRLHHFWHAARPRHATPLSGGPTKTLVRPGVTENGKFETKFNSFLHKPTTGVSRAIWSGTARRTVPTLNLLKTVSITRGASTPIGEAQVTLINALPAPIGSRPPQGRQDYDLDRRGYLTEQYGATDASRARWGQEYDPNSVRHLLVPDNVIRIYQGVRVLDPGERHPMNERGMVQTFVGLIKRIETAGTDMILHCRDTVELMASCTVAGPFHRPAWLPLRFGPMEGVTTTASLEPSRPITLTVAGASGSAPGHDPAKSLIDSRTQWWQSPGYSHPSAASSVPWVEYNLSTRSNLENVRFRAAHEGCVAYLHVRSNGQWLGSRSIGGLRYVAQQHVTDVQWRQFLHRARNVDRIRISFTNLSKMKSSDALYRASLYVVQAYTQPSTKGGKPPASTVSPRAQAGNTPGFVRDFSDIVRLCVAWSGLYWPPNATRWGDPEDPPNKRTFKEAPPVGRWDKVLVAPGGVWADIQQTGTAPYTTLDGYEHKSYLDVCQSIAEITGFQLFADETGAIVWRLPNYSEPGNWVATASPNPRRTRQILDLDERNTLVAYRASVSSENNRDQIVVTTPSGEFYSMTSGFTPNKIQGGRTAVWVDRFVSSSETFLMAEMIALRQMMKYRSGSVTCAFNPAIQVDDQIRVWDRSTGEQYLHLIEGISSNADYTAGKHTMELSTYWLGSGPDGTWALRSATEQSSMTQMYLSQARDRQISDRRVVNN